MPLQSWGATVTHIVDGDTFDVIWDDGYLPPQDLPNRIRVAGVDTNEKTLDQPFSNEATLRLAELLPIGTRVVLQAQDEQSSSLGRPVRHVIVDGVNIATILIQEGLGLAVSYEFESDYRDEYFAASEAARIAEAGMWEPGASGGDPSTWPAGSGPDRLDDPPGWQILDHYPAGDNPRPGRVFPHLRRIGRRYGQFDVSGL
jgi:endonuclease YncB( thermonuclease family)